MTRPVKRTSYKQGIYQISATRQERIGTRRKLADGREFVYSKAGASALSAGKMSMMADIAAAVINKAAVAAAVGESQLTLTIGSSTYAEDYFKGGYLQINDATSEGLQYEISASTAVTAGTSITITLEDKLVVALTTSSEFTLVHSPHMATIESTDEENHPVGIPPVAVTAAYYYWSQVKGVANVLCDSTIAVWSMCVPGTVAGSVKAMPSTLDVDMPIVGQLLSAAVDTEYKPINLNIV